MKKTLNRAQILPFLGVAAAWWLMGAAICHTSGSAMAWMTGFFLLSLLDLLALAKLFEHIFFIISLSPEDGSALSPEDQQKRIFSVIRASYWGTLKLVCLIFFGVVLSKGSSIPNSGLLTGIATMVVVPIFGGLFWHFRYNRSET